jgi:hypothetical protein
MLEPYTIIIEFDEGIQGKAIRCTIQIQGKVKIRRRLSRGVA